MPIRRYKPEQIVTVLRQIEVAMANGKSTPQACKEAGIHTQTYYVLTAESRPGRRHRNPECFLQSQATSNVVLDPVAFHG